MRKVRKWQLSFDVIGKGDGRSKMWYCIWAASTISKTAIAAITVAKYLGIEDDKIKAAVADFKGVRRSFEYALKNERHVLIDDYAHHPEELRALISGVKSIFPTKKNWYWYFSRTCSAAQKTWQMILQKAWIWRMK
jgi:UDP-N-acetylmuramate--alanine ligase